jgi:hypothetical protein
MFPGAPPVRHVSRPGVEKKGVKALLSLLCSTDAQEITTVDLEELTGICFQKTRNAISPIRLSRKQ